MKRFGILAVAVTAATLVCTSVSAYAGQPGSNGASAKMVATAAPSPAASRASLRCGDVITSSVVLTRDLVGCRADGLVIGAAGVTVDLNRHLVSGLGTSGSDGIRDEGFAGLTVRGGRIEHFDSGIDVENADHVTVVALQVRDTVFGILLVSVSGGILSAIDIETASFAGIQLAQADHLALVGNALSHNGDGISLFQSSRNLIAGNASVHSGSGIALLQSGANRIVKNSTNQEDDTGVLLDDHSDHNLIADNRASGNGFAGVGVGASVRNTVKDNQASDNLGSGIVVGDGASGTLVTGNRADRNGTVPPGCIPDCPLLDDGIHVDAPANTLTRNHADNNADLGIDAIAGVEDGGRNLAHHNKDPRECTNVACR